MPTKKKAKVPESHTYCFIAVSKISAYRRVGKIDEAKKWAALLMQHLKEEGLL